MPRNKDLFEALHEHDDDEYADIDEVTSENDEAAQRKVEKQRPFSRISIITCVLAAVVGIVGGIFVGASATERRIEAEKPREVVSVKAQSNTFTQLQDMREDMIVSLNSQLAATKVDAGSVTPGDLVATQQRYQTNSTQVDPLVTKILASDASLDDVQAFANGKKLGDDEQAHVKNLLDSATSEIVTNPTTGRPTNITFGGTSPHAMLGEHVEKASAPTIALISVASPANGGLVYYTYLVDVVITTADGVLHNAQYVVSVGNNAVRYVGFVGLLDSSDAGQFASQIAAADTAAQSKMTAQQ